MLPKALDQVIKEFQKFPTIGPKSAERLAFFLLKRSKADLEQFGQAILSLRNGVQLCQRCFYFIEHDSCAFCDNPYRDKSVVCVVETIPDVMALERIGDYNGLYHVLHGRIDPIHGLFAENIHMRELGERVKNQKSKIKNQKIEEEVGRSEIEKNQSTVADRMEQNENEKLTTYHLPLTTQIAELIIATEPDVEGETTALYIAKMLEGIQLRITRIGRGIPSGGNLEFADDMTLRNAMRGRTGM